MGVVRKGGRNVVETWVEIWKCLEETEGEVVTLTKVSV